MTPKNILKVVAIACSAVFAGTAANAAPLTNIGTNSGGVLLDGGSGPIAGLPIAGNTASKHTGFVNIGTDAGGVVIRTSGHGQVLGASVPRAKLPVSSYKNLGPNNGGIVVPR
ncbi:MAG: hypothetical protein JJ902_10985 [Roseibium sp.]|nr:hypothetical protein [Roseibium sp.]